MKKMLITLKNRIPLQWINAYHWLKAVIAVVLNGYPARDLTVIGITGTDGKTTTSHILYSILRAADLPASLISTTGVVISNNENQPLGFHVTTPNPFKLQKFLKTAKANGSKYIVLESTSHGFAQYRVLGCNFQIGAVTNITNEHLDYHKTYEEYLQAKARLFRNVKVSVLNKDDSSYEHLRPIANGKIVTYGLTGDVDITATDIHYRPDGTEFSLPVLGLQVSTAFMGDYNVQNMLAAVAIAKELGIDAQAIARGLESAIPPMGRLESVDVGQPFTVFVDFAHTSNGLEKLLSQLRPQAQNRLIVVFGSAGARDPFKRFPMGASAARYCDCAVLTAEDPRTEDLEKILDEIAAGCESEGGVLNKTYFRVPDRTEAIRYAIQALAQPGDIVVATGKAHEKSMCFGTTETPWDEFAAVHKALEIFK